MRRSLEGLFQKSVRPTKGDSMPYFKSEEYDDLVALMAKLREEGKDLSSESLEELSAKSLPTVTTDRCADALPFPFLFTTSWQTGC